MFFWQSHAVSKAAAVSHDKNFLGPIRTLVFSLVDILYGSTGGFTNTDTQCSTLTLDTRNTVDKHTLVATRTCAHGMRFSGKRLTSTSTNTGDFATTEQSRERSASNWPRLHPPLHAVQLSRSLSPSPLSLADGNALAGRRPMELKSCECRFYSGFYARSR